MQNIPDAIVVHGRHLKKKIEAIAILCLTIGK